MSGQTPVPLGRFQLFKMLKKGGMARVFLAIDPDDPEPLYAVKTLLPELVSKSSYRNMFTSEAEVGLRLHHPNIARTFEKGEDRNTPWIAMEYVFGFDLSTVLRRLRKQGRTMAVPMAVALALDVARALAYAHALSDEFGQPLDIVNRDVSPGNVMLAFDGQVKLIDFGIAQTTIDVRSQIGAIKGKISYMAPEQVRGLPVDHRVDLFSLGTVLYEMLTGVQVFRADSDFATMENVRRAEAPPPSTHVAAVDDELDGIVQCALAVEPSERFPSASSFATALLQWLERHGEVDRAAERSAFLSALFPDQLGRMTADIAEARDRLTGTERVGQESQGAPDRFISEADLDDLFAAEARAETSSTDLPARHPRRGWLAVGALAALVSAVAIWWLTR